MSTQHTVESAALVTAAREGDLQAQEALVNAYLPLVYNVVGRALNGSVDVDDVVQDTMLRALDGLGSLRTPESFRSWLVAIAMNRVRAYWQDRQSAPGAVEDAGEFADPGADFVDLTMMRLQLSGQRLETARATRWLEPDDRSLLSLWWLECAGELTRAETAQALELSPQHTAVRVQRMKAQLDAARVVVRALEAQPPCEDLRALLAPWDGRPSPLWRKRIARHARDCVRCTGQWSGLMPAEGLLAGLALVPVSAALLSNVRDTLGATAPAGSATPLDAAGSRDGAGSAVKHRSTGEQVTSRAAARRRRRNRQRVVGGAIAAACLVGTGMWYFDTDSGAGTEGTAARQTPAAPLAEVETPDAAASSPSTSPSASASPSKSASKSASPSAKPRTAKSAPASKKPPQAVQRASSTPTAQSAPAGTVAQVIALVNKERASAGCGPVTDNAQLRDAAQKHSDDMAARNFFDHTNPDGDGPGERITAAGYRWSTFGENIAKGQQSPESVMDSWMNSPGHRANILNCSFKELGVGVHNGSGGPWWTQDFGTKL
ncbi:sigma-70 family RNA polymerase sigma factor [Streptomyces sp. NPDC086549]|uniref:sigma-70 family RNA polymerase sigma factor n=1 Tax=Streptomyces sp. NPDC086549 TaxID=3365752 RepID=UPI0038115B6A